MLRPEPGTVAHDWDTGVKDLSLPSPFPARPPRHYFALSSSCSLPSSCPRCSGGSPQYVLALPVDPLDPTPRAGARLAEVPSCRLPALAHALAPVALSGASLCSSCAPALLPCAAAPARPLPLLLTCCCPVPVQILRPAPSALCRTSLAVVAAVSRGASHTFGNLPP